MRESDTIVAPATAEGQSAVALIRVSGEGAWELARGFNGGNDPLPRRVWHGDYVTISGKTIDDVLFIFFAAPRSYTGEPVLEISSHGNPLIVRLIAEDLCARGCRVAEPGEFTRRAFLNGRMDLSRAEAVMDVIRSRSETALEMAQQQLRGALGRKTAALAERLQRVCAECEAYIDFPEEDLPAEDVAAREAELVALSEELQRLAATRRQQELLSRGITVALVGAPNAGKSTLFNRLVGYDRAIVSEEPGTTRDFLEGQILLDGYCIRLIDTAGLRESGSVVERAGVSHSERWVEDADLLVCVIDRTDPTPALPSGIRTRLQSGRGIIALNKVDLPPAAAQRPDLEDAIGVSGLDGQGIEHLQAALREKVTNMMRLPADEDVMVNARHAEALRRALKAVNEGLALLRKGSHAELVANELREAIHALGEIDGRTCGESVLDQLFSAFCIGK